MSNRLYGVSTHLFHDTRLERDHLVEIAAHGFDCIELFATRTHFDYHDSVAVRSLAEWLEVEVSRAGRRSRCKARHPPLQR